MCDACALWRDTDETDETEPFQRASDPLSDGPPDGRPEAALLLSEAVSLSSPGDICTHPHAWSPALTR